MSYWKDKVVWITGASSGIGKALAQQLVLHQARLILSARSKDKLETIAAELRSSDRQISVLPMDVSLIDEAKQRVAQAMKCFGTIDVVIHNAGITQRDTALNSSIDVDRTLMEVNYMGPVAITKVLLPHFIHQKQGHIAVTSSVAAMLHTPLRSAYCSSKAALHGFFDALRAENHTSNIKVTLICPGFIQTDISKNALTGSGNKYDKVDGAILKGIPVDDCAKRYLKAIEDGKDEVIIAGVKERFGLFINKHFPWLFRKMVRKMKVT